MHMTSKQFHCLHSRPLAPFRRRRHQTQYLTMRFHPLHTHRHLHLLLHHHRQHQMSPDLHLHHHLHMPRRCMYETFLQYHMRLVRLYLQSHCLLYHHHRYLGNMSDYLCFQFHHFHLETPFLLDIELQHLFHLLHTHPQIHLLFHPYLHPTNL